MGNALRIFLGTRNHDRRSKQMLPFKTGAFSAAIQACLPVLPVVFAHYDFLGKH